MILRIYKNALKAIILLYQKTFSMFLGRQCRFYPSCSNYALWLIDFQAFCFGKIIFRILRCNPHCAGGIDYPILKLKICVNFAHFTHNFEHLNSETNFKNKHKKIKYWLAPLEQSKCFNATSTTFLINAKFRIIKSF